MKRTVLAVLVAMVVGFHAGPAGATGLTITAAPDSHYHACYDLVHVSGKALPSSSSHLVWLQRTVRGVWRDARSWGSKHSYQSGAPAAAMGSTVGSATGNYAMTYLLISTNTQHFRVRSNGGSVVSPGFYVHVTTAC